MRQTDLVSGANVLLFPVNVDALGDVGTLLLQSHQHIASFVVKTCRKKLVIRDKNPTARVKPFSAGAVFLAFVGVVVADVLDGVPHHLLVVHVGPRRDLSTEQHHASLTHRFCGKKNKNKYLVFLMLKIYFYNSDLWKSCCKNSISLLFSANAKG